MYLNVFEHCYQLGVLGGDREGRLFVSSCSTELDLTAGFNIFSPISFRYSGIEL